MKQSVKESRSKGQPVVSAHQAASLLGMDRHDVRRLLQQAKIRGHKAQEQWEIPFSEIRRWARLRTERGARNSLTPAQMARELAISRQAEHQKIREGRLSSRKVGHLSEIRRWARFRTELRAGNSLTPAQVARELGISRQAVHQKIREGRLGSRRVGHRRLVPRSALEEELRKREHKGLWDLNRVSRELGITRQQIYRLLRSGHLNARKIGYYYFVLIDEVRIFKKAREC